MTPRRRTAAGTPDGERQRPRRRQAPEGRDEQDQPERGAGEHEARVAAVSAATSRPAPAGGQERVGQAADRARLAAASPVPGSAAGTSRSADSASPPATASSGSRPRNTHRQPSPWPTTRGDRRPDDPGHHPGRGQHREHARLEALRQAPADGDVRGRADRPAAQALDEPGADEHRHRRRQAADREPEREQAEARSRTGATAACRSRAPPVTTMPIRLPRKKAE